MQENLLRCQTGYVLGTQGITCDIWLPDNGGCSGIYLEDIYSDWPEVKRTKLAKKTIYNK